MLYKIKYRIIILGFLKPFANGVKRFFFISFILSSVGLLLSFVQPLFYKMFVDDVILNKQWFKLRPVIIGYIAIFFCNTLIGYMKYYANNRLINRVTFRVKFKIWRSLFKEDFPSYEKMNIGDTKMRIDDDIKCISSFLGGQSIDYIIHYAKLITALVLMIIIKWQLALFSIIVIPITFILDHMISKKEWKMNEKNRENDQMQSSWLHTVLKGWREIKALNLQRHEERKLIRFTHTFSKYYIKSNNYMITRIFVLPKIKDEFFMQFSLYFIGGLLIIHENLTIGALLVFAQYYSMLAESVKAVSLADANLQSSRAASDRVIAEINKSNVPITRERLVLDQSNTIVFENVSFKYPQGERDIFENFNLRIEKGERVAITGKSGCGKTTLLKLLTGLIEPTQGNVYFSGVNIKEIDLSKMQERIGFVMQNNMLFNDSIRENLLYGKNNASDSELDEACKKAYIYEFIDSLPKKYETIIGENGIKLSGGQRQRIVLARLFLRQIDVFIFDEATSALDQNSEGIIQDAIKNIGQDKTIIVVAHRKSAILGDKILRI